MPREIYTLHISERMLAPAAFLLAILATANGLNLNLVMESAGEIHYHHRHHCHHCHHHHVKYLDETDIGADGRIFGSGINFNSTSLSDVGMIIIIITIMTITLKMIMPR